MQLVALMASKISDGVVAIDRSSFIEQCGLLCRYPKLLRCIGSSPTCQKVELRKSSNGNISSLRPFSEIFCCISGKPYSHIIAKEHAVSCHCTSTRNSESRPCKTSAEDQIDVTSQLKDEGIVETSTYIRDDQTMCGRASASSIRGLAEACKFAYNDAKFVNKKARNDIILLSRGITRLNNRARRDVAVLGLGFLKLDARAREDTEKIDNGVRQGARMHNVVTGNAQSKLQTVVDKHWSDGALEADLRRADFVVRRRAMEDAFIAMKFVKEILEVMGNKLYQQPQKQGSFSVSDMMGFVTLEKNGMTSDLLARDVSTDRITAIQEAYWSMASALSDVDGIDYTNPEELELLVATLIDLDAMDGKSSASLLAECSSSPDDSTRQALANALAAAPSMWLLGNAGMGALQRLADDSNPAVAAAASKAIAELRQQWELEEGDSLKFMMNHSSPAQDEDDSDSEADN